MLIAALVIALVLLVVFFVVVRALVGLALAVLVALVAGLIAESLVGERRHNPLFTIVLGFIGAIIGAIIADLLGLPRLISLGGLPVVWTVVGTIVVVAVWHALRPKQA